jgi:hypothetical protein
VIQDNTVREDINNDTKLTKIITFLTQTQNALAYENPPSEFSVVKKMPIWK